MVQMLVRSHVAEKTKRSPSTTQRGSVGERAATGCGRGARLTAHEASDSQGMGGATSVAHWPRSQKHATP